MATAFDSAAWKAATAAGWNSGATLALIQEYPTSGSSVPPRLPDRDAPIVANLVKLAISRRREYLADASGALLTRYPDGLANALAKIAAYEQPLKRASSATAHLYISNPFGPGASKSFLTRLFSTHPPLDKRIERLGTIGGKF